MSHRLNKTLYQIKVHVGKKCQMKFFTMEKIDFFFFFFRIRATSSRIKNKWM